jgi:hypothetical protein
MLRGGWLKEIHTTIRSQRGSAGTIPTEIGHPRESSCSTRPHGSLELATSGEPRRCLPHPPETQGHRQCIQAHSAKTNLTALKTRLSTPIVEIFNEEVSGWNRSAPVTVHEEGFQGAPKKVKAPEASHPERPGHVLRQKHPEDESSHRIAKRIVSSWGHAFVAKSNRLEVTKCAHDRPGRKPRRASKRVCGREKVH